VAGQEGAGFTSLVERVSWTESKVYVGLNRDAIQSGPEYDESTPSRESMRDGSTCTTGGRPIGCRKPSMNLL